ncbi:MAG: hypothetical protein V7K32_28830 [Nostoc sp.]
MRYFTPDLAIGVWLLWFEQLNLVIAQNASVNHPVIFVNRPLSKYHTHKD